MADVLERTETIDHLDIPIPCTDDWHDEGRAGCDPAAPAAYAAWSPCCGLRAYLCAGRVAVALTCQVTLCRGCGRMWLTHQWSFKPIEVTQ